jgi:hypothetical protein
MKRRTKQIFAQTSIAMTSANIQLNTGADLAILTQAIAFMGQQTTAIMDATGTSAQMPLNQPRIYAQMSIATTSARAPRNTGAAHAILTQESAYMGQQIIATMAAMAALAPPLSLKTSAPTCNATTNATAKF